MDLDRAHMLMGLVAALALVFSSGLLIGRIGLRRGAPGQRKSKSGRGVLEIPRVWPFDPRRVASSAERKAWAWLRETFPDHQVLLKLPVTRFVIPQRQSKAETREWFQLLASIYCTFTVCTDDGRVLGCLDLMTTPDGLPRINRQIKETLLEQCGISYWAVPHDRLPEGKTLRTEFLGASAREIDMEPPASQFQMIEDVRQRLHETLDRNRAAHRPAGSAPAPLDSRPFDPSRPFDHDNRSFADTQIYDPNSPPSNMASGLQPNSFLASMPSDRAELEHA